VTSAISKIFKLHHPQTIQQTTTTQIHLTTAALSPGHSSEQPVRESKPTKRQRSSTTEMASINQPNTSTNSKSTIPPIFNFNIWDENTPPSKTPRTIDPDEIVIRLYGNKLNQSTCPFKTKQEIDRHLEPEIRNKITKAFVNIRNNQLYIITKSTEAANSIKENDWSQE
jgi:hypothetical protein